MQSNTSTWREQIALQAVCSSLQTKSFLCWGYTQSVCCLLESRASAALEGADCPCKKKKKKKKTLRARSRRRKEPSPAFLAVPARFRGNQGGALAALVGIADGSGGRNEDGRVLMLRHGGDLDRGDRTWIWRTGWRWVRPISTCIPQI